MCVFKKRKKKRKTALFLQVTLGWVYCTSISMHGCILGANCSNELLFGVFSVCVCCSLAGTSHSVTGSCLAFFMRRSRAGGAEPQWERWLLQPQEGTPAWLFPSHFFFSLPPSIQLSPVNLFVVYPLHLLTITFSPSLFSTLPIMSFLCTFFFLPSHLETSSFIFFPLFLYDSFF